MRDSRATKMSQIYTPREFLDNPVEIRGLNEGWDRLRGAIIEQAIVDYMKALRTIMTYPPEYREYSMELYRFGSGAMSRDDYYESIERMRSWGVEFKIVIPKDDRWYGFTGKHLTTEQLEAVMDWQGEFYTRVMVDPNKISRGISAVRRAYEMKQDCERFFNSDMYKTLCRIDKDYLLRIMREKVEEEYETGTMPIQAKKSKKGNGNHKKKH